MKISLLGYGRMGKEIEKIALQHNHEIVAKIDSEKDWENYFSEFKKSDVAIEFSIPATVVGNINKCFDNNIPIVVGTTAWHEHFEEIKSKCQTENKTMFFASNFSIGVNIFFEINKKLSTLMSNRKDYSVEIEEIHHTQKLDAPSGTAITLANDIIKNLEQKTKWVKENAVQNDELPIKSKRIGEIPGTHIITYDSPTDTIEIKHTAKSRKGFALGAMLAAEFIKGKSGFFEMKDLLGI
ncbi:MAG: 4-hydroxy-tetrahydrodipicolinate reductase [Saprospiraceae bacterium]|nr:4-hydroxy-tetrahydrodipicolinate reductase [Saprospiraceae bacterium]